MKKFKKKLFFYSLLSLVFVPNLVLALEVDYPTIRFPGGVFDLNSAFEAGKITIESLIIYIYAMLLILAGILMFISLTRVGFTFIYSGSNPSKRTEAKKRFFSILIGLIILIFSFTFLNIINPDITRLDEPLFINDSSTTGTFTCSWNDSVGSCEVGTINCELGYEVSANTCKTNILNACDFSTNNTCVSGFSFSGYTVSTPTTDDAGTFSCSWNGSSCTLIESPNCKNGYTAVGNCEIITGEDFCDSSETYTCSKVGTFDCAWDGEKCITGTDNCGDEDFYPDATKCANKDIDSCGQISATCIR